MQDNQTSVKILVLQGESERAEENELLGEFVLDGLRPARRGEVEIEVTFEISADGIVGVSAKDVETGQRQSITVTATSGLTEDELRRILDEQLDEQLQRKQTTREIERAAPVGRADGARRSRRSYRRCGPRSTGRGSAATRCARPTAVLARARAAIASRDVDALAAEAEPLERTLALFQGLAAGGQPPGGR